MEEGNTLCKDLAYGVFQALKEVTDIEEYRKLDAKAVECAGVCKEMIEDMEKTLSISKEFLEDYYKDPKLDAKTASIKQEFDELSNIMNELAANYPTIQEFFNT
jgi:flagellar capping protein FliD